MRPDLNSVVKFVGASNLEFNCRPQPGGTKLNTIIMINVLYYQGTMVSMVYRGKFVMLIVSEDHSGSWWTMVYKELIDCINHIFDYSKATTAIKRGNGLKGWQGKFVVLIAPGTP